MEAPAGAGSGAIRRALRRGRLLGRSQAPTGHTARSTNGRRPGGSGRIPAQTLLLAGLATLCVAVSAPSGCGSTKWEGTKQTLVVESGVTFRAHGDFMQIDRGDGWEDFFVQAVNLTAGVPGTVPGELAASREDYDQWLVLMADMGVNVLRLYTLHHPRFYEAFAQYNLDHPDKPLYLLQGIWLDEIEEDKEGNFEGDYITDQTEVMDLEIQYVIDAVHGDLLVDPGPERWGKAFGEYRTDVSSFVVGFIAGHEMLGHIVHHTNEIWADFDRYDGTYVSSPPGLPIEAWVARFLDGIIDHERSRWGDEHAVAWANWPTLDPMHHPTESSRFSNDLVDCDFARFTLHDGFEAGLFVSYHVYPFNPEFIIFDPIYQSVTNAAGQADPYLGYLLDLKAHYPDIPVLITELGIPSSQGVAHVNPYSFDHGGYDEQGQAEAVTALWRDVVESGCAGGAVFEIIDEWFKRTWMTNPTTQPEDRARLWYDVLNPEESFGIMSWYPVPGMSKTIDGDLSDWDAADVLVEQAANPVASVGDGKDGSRTLDALSVGVDPAYLFLNVGVAEPGVPDLESVIYYVGISTMGGETGGRRIPGLDVLLPPELGLESLLVIDASLGRVWLMTDLAYDPSPRINGVEKEGGCPKSNEAAAFSLSRWLIMNDEHYLEDGLDIPGAVKTYFEPGRRTSATRSSTPTPTSCPPTAAWRCVSRGTRCGSRTPRAATSSSTRPWATPRSACTRSRPRASGSWCSRRSPRATAR